MPSIYAPFPNIAVHIVKPKSIGWETAYLGRAVSLKVDEINSYNLAKIKKRCGPGPAGVFPLGLAR